MKTFHSLKSTVFLAFVGFLIFNFNILQAQDNSATSTATATAKAATEMPIVVFSYMKSKNDDYAKMEKEIWKPYMKKMIEDKKMAFWAVYDVEYPNGKNADYDFVTINVFANMNQMENAWVDYDDRMKKIHPKLDLKNLDKRTEDSRDLVWNEAFRLVNSAEETLEEAAEIIVVNRMQSKPGKYNEYIKMENSIYLPAHKISVKRGYRKNWHFLSRAMPYGDEYGYDFITIDSYESMVQMAKATPANVWRDAHPDKEIEEIWEEINPNKLRFLKRGETWRNIIYENGKSTSTVKN